MGVRATMYGSQKSHYENEEKFENDRVLRNGNRINTTQPISIILVSLFSEDNVQSDKIKTCYIFEYQSNENRTSFGGTPGIINCKHGKHKVFAQPPVCYARMTVIRATRRVFHECEWGGKNLFLDRDPNCT